MLLPEDIHPEECIYYIGSILIKEIENEKNLTFAELFFRVNEKKRISLNQFILALDWLYLINYAFINNKGVVEKCLSKD